MVVGGMGAGTVAGAEGVNNQPEQAEGNQPKEEHVIDAKQTQEFDNDTVQGVVESGTKTNLEQLKEKVIKKEAEIAQKREDLNVAKADSFALTERFNSLVEGLKATKEQKREFLEIPEEVESFLHSFLEKNQEKLRDQEFLKKVEPSLKNLMGTADNPLGERALNFARFLEDHYSVSEKGHTKDSGLVYEITEAQWRVYLADLLLKLAESSLESLKSKVAELEEVTTASMEDVASSQE